MLFVAKSAAPRAAPATLDYLPSNLRDHRHIICLHTTPGYISGALLAAQLTSQYHALVWLRIGPEDRDPATLLLSLIQALQRVAPRAGMSIFDQMRRYPGPVAGWHGLYMHLADELVLLPRRSVIVIEHLDRLGAGSPALHALCTHMLPHLPNHIDCVLTTTSAVPELRTPDVIELGPAELALSEPDALTLAERSFTQLPRAVLCQAVERARGQADLLESFLIASWHLGADVAQRILDRTPTNGDLLAQIGRMWFDQADASDRQMASLALYLEYNHPALWPDTRKQDWLCSEPWMQALENDWAYLRGAWQTPLRGALRSRAQPAHDLLDRVAALLAEQGAILQAVPLYLEVNRFDQAAAALDGVVDAMMNLGQWETLDRWIGRLTPAQLSAHPWLAYASGEIAAARGRADTAQRNFTIATSVFSATRDASGLCQSQLAESTIASWIGNHERAQALAQAALNTACTARLPWYQCWAAWQLSCLAALRSDLETALIYLSQAIAAADILNEAPTSELLHAAEQVMAHQHSLLQQREYHRQAYFALDHAEHEALEQIRSLTTRPSEKLETMLSSHGWVNLPLLLKFGIATHGRPHTAPAGAAQIWNRLLGLLRGHAVTAPPAAAESLTAPPATSPAPALVIRATSAYAQANPALAGAPALTSVQTLQLFERPIDPGTPVARLDLPVDFDRPSLTAHMLGPFRITLNDRPVESWPSGRGRALLKYLLAHHTQPVPRDVLMDTFWPDSPPDDARNSLNVAMHGLRQALRAVTDHPVVSYQREDGAYRLDPAVVIWIDVDEFERHEQAARRFEASGQLQAAAASYEVAAGLYQGDFLADDPYEEWPLLTRERLRLAYLDTLDRLSQIYLSQNQYAACATLCQLILARDNCREDIHCRLMRCYSRQGQHHLALRQYQVCTRALNDDLGIEAGPGTIQLAESIRRREYV